MKNPEALAAILSTADHLGLPLRHRNDLLVDAECMVGKFSGPFSNEFGWVIYEDGTHMLNPVKFPYVTGTFVERTFGSRDGEMYMFWWNGEKLYEVTAEEMDQLLWYGYEFFARLDQLNGLMVADELTLIDHLTDYIPQLPVYADLELFVSGVYNE